MLFYTIICFIGINDYTFNLYGCKNNHITKNILIENFEDTQKIQHENHNNHGNEKEDYNCNKHNGEQFIKYCKNHKKNLCIQCESEHKNCKTIYFGYILPDKNRLNLEELRDNPNEFFGTIGDASEIIRITLCGRKSSPNLYYVEKILGKDEIERRFNKIIK